MFELDSRTEQQNFGRLIQDIGWFGFASAATLRFLPYFALRMGATPLEVGLITALPAVMLFIVNWLSGWWHHRYTNSVRAMILPTVVHRMVFLLPFFTVFLPEESRPFWIILSVVLPSIGQGISSTVFIIIMREAVSQAQITHLMARRKLWMSVAIAAGTLLSGVLLQVLPFPLNYQVVFLVGFGGSLISFYHLTKIKVTEREPPPAIPFVRLVREQVGSTNTRSVVYVTLTTFAAFYFIVGVIPVHLEALGATEGFIAIFGVVELIAAVASSFVTVRLVQVFGNRGLVAVSVMATSVAAVVLAIAGDVWLTLIAAAFTGAAWTIADIAMFGYFTERTRTENMGATMVYNEMMYVGMFVGPLLGNSLLQLGMSTVSVLMLGAGLRVLAGLLVQWRNPRQQTQTVAVE